MPKMIPACYRGNDCDRHCMKENNKMLNRHNVAFPLHLVIRHCGVRPRGVPVKQGGLH